MNNTFLYNLIIINEEFLYYFLFLFEKIITFYEIIFLKEKYDYLSLTIQIIDKLLFI